MDDWIGDSHLELEGIDVDCVLADDWMPRGIGKACEAGNTTWFLVLDWPSANDALARLGFPAHDFHITLGFADKDVHGVTKDASTIQVELDADEILA